MRGNFAKFKNKSFNYLIKIDITVLVHEFIR